MGAALLASSATASATASAKSIDQDWTSFNPEKWSANATGRALLIGQDTTKPFPKSENKLWEAFLDIHTDSQNGDDAKGGSVAVRIGAHPTSGTQDTEANFDSDSSWETCMGFMRFSNLPVPADEEIEPTCEGVLDDDCLAALQDFAKSGKLCASGDGEAIEWPSACEKGEGNALKAVIQDREAGKDSQRVVTQGYKKDLKADESSDDLYEDLARSIWLVNLGWAPSKEAKQADGSKVPSGSIACIRTTAFAKGSFNPLSIDREDVGERLDQEDQVLGVSKKKGYKGHATSGGGDEDAAGALDAGRHVLAAAGLAAVAVWFGLVL